MSRGEAVRRARQLRGWSQSELAKQARVSLRTITRIETETDYDDPRTLPQVERALGIGESAAETGPTLRGASAAQLAAELATRLAEHEQMRLSLDRITTSDAPLTHLQDRGDVGRGPRVVGDDEAAGSDAHP